MYPLVETIKISDGIPLYLEWHQRRMDYAFHVLFGTNNPFRLSELIVVENEFRKGVIKCRFLYNDREFVYEFTEYNPGQVKTLQLVHSDNIDYSHKYTNRTMINNLLEQKGAADDILIVRDGLITDTSYTNIVFFDGTSWVSPAEPLLEGTCRNRLLAEGKIKSTNIRPKDLKQYSVFRLINAMIDFEEQGNTGVDKILENDTNAC